MKAVATATAAIAACEDCGLDYQDFGLDIVLLNEEWLKIHPESTEGLLCANCIVKRASHLSGTIFVKLLVFRFEEGHNTKEDD